MIEEPRVIPECFGDTLVIKKILRKSVNHIKTNGRIAEYLSKQPNNNIVIAITDDDKNKPTKFSELGFTKSTNKSHTSLILHHKPNSKHIIIFIKPALEKWLLNCCDEVSFDRSRYSFLRNLDEIKVVFKKENIAANPEVNKFLKELIDENPPSILKLKEWITEALIS